MICFDYGHGGKDPGATFGTRRESDEVLALGQKVAKALRKYGIRVDETRTKDESVSLTQRVTYANKGNYEYFISFHRNSCSPPGPKGVEVFTTKKCGPKAARLANNLQRALVQLGFYNRGAKQLDFYLLERTKMPAVLIELGFINHPVDNHIVDTYEDELVQTIVMVILKELGRI